MAEKPHNRYAVFKTPIGCVRVTATDRGVAAVEVLEKFLHARLRATKEKILSRARRQILDYLSGESRRFTIPLDIQGTRFQQIVWRNLLKIPYGKTATYGEIARRIGCPRAARAVGMACRKNPVGIVVPCHRVIGTSGGLTGYSMGLALKRKLLDLEQKREHRQNHIQKL